VSTASTVTPPDTIRELRVAAIAGTPHYRSMRRVCSVVDVLDQDWSAGPESGPPHLLLIETSGLRRRRAGGGSVLDEKIERALELVDWAEAEGVPTALWETALATRIETPLALARKVSHLFVADPEAVLILMDRLDGRRPMQLPLAAQNVPPETLGFNEREREVGFLARWPAGFAGSECSELEAILDAASERDLVIFQREPDIGADDLPERFSSFVEPVPSTTDAIESLQRSRIVIGFDPRNYGRLMVPQVCFEALAAGCALIAPWYRGSKLLFPHVSFTAKTRDKAAATMEQLLGNESEWAEVSDRGRKAIVHAHRYAHRLATVASAVGLRLLPRGSR
jgi:hypothetical protein